MYTFTIKDTGPDINVVVTRALLALAGIVSLLYRSNQFYFINIAAAVVLFIVAVFVNRLFGKVRYNSSLLLYIAAVILFIATHSVPFAALLVLYGMLGKKIYKDPVIHVNTEGISIVKMFGNVAHQWNEFNNIILKDNLLTMDFKNNKLLQLNISEKENMVDENSFNTFCRSFIAI